jgi:hypothetical protein
VVPIGSGELAAAYYQSANTVRLLGDPSGFCQPGQSIYPSTEYVTMSCYDTTVTGAGDTLTISWAARPIRCFEGGCGWN